MAFDFTGFDFTGFDFAGFDFTGFDFAGFDFAGFDFAGQAPRLGEAARTDSKSMSGGLQGSRPTPSAIAMMSGA
jgi:hypothetical protein